MKNDTDFVRLEEYMNAKPSFDAAQCRADFPILTREVRPGVPVVYLDSTATSQKPLAVIEAMDDYYRRSNANVHRGIHALAEEATALYEGGRERVAKFINARTTKEIIFTRNTSEAIDTSRTVEGRPTSAPGMSSSSPRWASSSLLPGRCSPPGAARLDSSSHRGAGWPLDSRPLSCRPNSSA
jgi:hypothetical protein